MSKIEIDKSEYFDLKRDQELLRRLEGGGVDNWDWYSESIDFEDLEAWEKTLKIEIFGDDAT